MTPYADISERRRVARQGMQRLREDPEYKAREAEAARIARENSRTMNAKIISAAESGKRYGDIFRSGQPTPTDPGHAGGPWTDEAYRSWRRRAFRRALAAAGIEHARPYDLRHSFASLLLHQGRSVIYVARQLGHGAQLTLGTYGHVIDELDDRPQQDAESAITDARASWAAHPLPIAADRA
jgi:integrase